MNSKKLVLKLLVVLTAGFGFQSAMAEPVPPGKVVTFNFVNGTKGIKEDKDIYWSIIGKDWVSKKFVRYDLDTGTLVPMKVEDNNKLSKNGQSYTDYFYSLAQRKSVKLPAIDSARILLSVGEKMYIKVLDTNGLLGYAGASVENKTDPNMGVNFDFIEMAIVPPSGEIFINTSRVDHFGFPVQLRLEGAGGYNKVVGEPVDPQVGKVESRADLFKKFKEETPPEFHNLIQNEIRIIAPAHGDFKDGANANYLDSYIQSIWDKYKKEDLVFTNSQGFTYTGRVGGNGEFTFRETDVPKGKEHEKRPAQETYRIKKMPTTAQTLLGNGVLDDPSDANGDGERIKRQLAIQAQLCAALNRGVAGSPEKWKDHSAYYPKEQRSNSYSKFWHDHNIDRLSYGFSYDDVWDASASLHSINPTTATITIGW